MPLPLRARPVLAGLGWFAASAVTSWATWGILRPVVVPPIGWAAGLTLAGILSGGPKRALPLLLGITAGVCALGVPLPLALAPALLSVLQALLAWSLLRWAFRSRAEIGRVPDVGSFVVATAIAALAGGSLATRLLLSVPMRQPLPPLQTWLFLWTSQFLGMLLVVPPIVHALRRRDRAGRDRFTAENLVVAALALAVGGWLFLDPHLSSSAGRALPLLVLPMLAWIALRGPRDVALTLPGVLVLTAVAGSVRHVGLFAEHDYAAVMMSLQGLAGALAVSTLAITAAEADRRRATREALEREARLQRVLAGTRDGFWDWNARSGRLAVSERTLAILGAGAGELVAWPDSFLARVHPDDVPSVRATLAGGLGQRSEPYEVEYRVRRPDGATVWVLERGRVSERDAAGHAQRVSGTFTDISVRKQAELELCAAREMFERFMRHSPAPASIRDEHGNILFMNDALERVLWGDSPQEWRGRNLADLHPPEVVDVVVAGDREVLDSGVPRVVERWLVGTIEPIKAVTIRFPLHGPGGERLLGSVAVDVTAQRLAEDRQRALEERAADAQRLESLGRLAGGVAHDFNNILTSILGFSELTRERLPADDPAREYMASVLEGARRASVLTRQMLACAGREPVQRRRVDLSGLVGQMALLLRVSVPRRIEFTLETLGEIPAVEGDETQLRHVVTNLTLNAAEAIGDADGEIAMRLFARDLGAAELASRWSAAEAAPGRYVVLEVTDDGCGISAETLPHVFDPFYTTKFTGRGMGLAAVLGIVRSSGGVMQVESRPGAGSTFRVLLPVSSAPAAAPLRAAGAGAARAALVVDDEESVRELAVMMLGRSGFANVLSAANGQRGIELLAAHADDIDAVLLDVNLPDMPGETVFRELRARCPQMRVVVSSGYGAPDWYPAGCPFTGFVAKPYRLAELGRAMRGALETADA
jgi:PAS domain S-box-containing protein